MLKLLVVVAITLTSFVISHPLDSKEENKVSLSHFNVLKRLGGGGKKATDFLFSILELNLKRILAITSNYTPNFTQSFTSNFTQNFIINFI